MKIRELRQYGQWEVLPGRRPRWPLLELVLMALWGRGGPSLAAVLRLQAYCRSHRFRVFSYLFGRVVERRYGCYISPKAQLGIGIHFPHPVGIVIGEGVVVGHHCTIFQHVTLGSARIGEAALNRYPNIGDDVTLFTGAVVVGQITIGNGAVVAANAVVITNVEPGQTVGGIPARPLESQSSQRKRQGR